MPPWFPPAVTGIIQYAHGRSSSVSSSTCAVWYPIMRTFTRRFMPGRSPAGRPGELSFHFLESTTCPSHQKNPSLPTKFFFKSPCSNIISRRRFYIRLLLVPSHRRVLVLWDHDDLLLQSLLCDW